MTTIQPDGERLRKAVTWIAAEVKAGSPKRRQELIQEAGLTFNLTPVEAEYLARSFDDITAS